MGLILAYTTALAAAGILFSFIDADQMHLTLYKNEDYTGPSVTVYETYSEFSCITQSLTFDEGFNSLCYLGSWHTGKSSGSVSFPPYTTRICFTMASGYVNVTSVSRFGPPDTSTTAITFGWTFSGQDIRVVEQADANLNITSSVIVVAEVYTSGTSSWKLYQNKNFEGNSVCLTPTSVLQRHIASQLGLPSIGSVVKGCPTA